MIERYFKRKIPEKGLSSTSTNGSIENEKNDDKRSHLEVNLYDLLADSGLKKNW